MDVGAFQELGARSKVALVGVQWDQFPAWGAQRLAWLGVPDRTIQALGRWKSACFKRYVGMLSQELLGAGFRMSRGESVSIEEFEEVSFDVRTWSAR